jgi:hypothetical protein
MPPLRGFICHRFLAHCDYFSQWILISWSSGRVAQ